MGEAIAHRSSRQKSSYTNKELKKNMEKFLETGVHPDMERAKVRAIRVVHTLTLLLYSTWHAPCSY